MTGLTGYAPDPDLPPPDGAGFAGFAVGTMWGTTYNEMIASCLSSPMIAGTEYNLSFWMAQGIGCMSVDIVIYGTDDCADMPWAGFECPDGIAGWEILGTTTVTFTATGEWTEVIMSFTPTFDVAAISIGGPCAGMVPCGGDVANYYYIDNLLLIDNSAFIDPLVETGSWCDGDLMLEANIDTVGGTWNWALDGVGLPGETTNTIDVMSYGPGTYTAIYTLDGECTTEEYEIILPDVPIADFTWVDQCDGDAMDFTDNSIMTGSGILTDWDWDFDDGGATSTDQNPTYAFSGPGTYDVELTVTGDNGCTNTITQTVTVFPEPTADFEFVVNGTSSTTGLLGACLGETVDFMNNTIVDAPDFITITNWDFGDGNTAAIPDPSHTYTAEGTYTVELAVETNNGCQDTITMPVEIWPIPVPDFTVTPVCENSDAVFTNTSIITSGSITGFEWNFDDGSPDDLTSGPVNHSYSAGTYNPQLVVTSDNGCVDSISYALDIYSVPTAEFTTSDVCNGETSVFTDASTIGSGAITTWSYDFGDGSPLDPGASTTHDYALAGTYSVTLTVTSDNGCTDDTTIVHNVSSAPTADFSTADVCQDTDASFTDLSFVTSGAITYWEWDFGDGSGFDYTTGSVDHSYGAEGTYDVTLIVFAGSSACADTVTYPVTIHPMPTADFTTADVCQDVTASFTDASTVSSGSITTYDWDFGDGNSSSSASPTNPYATDGAFTVTLTVTTDNGCTDAITQPINIWAVPVADFTTVDICENEGPTSFTNASSISSGTYTSAWDFGDGGTGSGTNPTHGYSDDGTYTVTLTITSNNGCTATITKPANVLEQPTAAFTSDPPVICNPGCVKFYDGSSGVSPVLNWEWDFGNGAITTGQNPNPCFQHQSDYTEYYDVTLTVTNAVGCSHSVSSEDYVAVEATPTAEFLFNPTVLTIENTQVAFENRSEAASTYTWDFGDESPINSEVDPEHTFPDVAGEYIVRLDAYSASGACHDYTQKLIVVDDVIIFYVPNVFTPDGDEYNEVFKPMFFSGYDPFDYHLTIFNRWGEVVFESYNANYGWNGTYGSQGLVEDGTYVWQIEFKETMSDKKHRHRGHVTILK